MRIAILTPSQWDPQYYAAELERQRALFADAGHEVVDRRWHEADDAFLRTVDAVLPLIAWGYHLDAGRWFDLIDRIAYRRIACVNHPDILRWNSDKAYLGELADKGVAVVPTLDGEGGDDQLLARAGSRFVTDKLVVKPRLSASGEGTYALRPDDPMPGDLDGKRVIVQPFLADILSGGEMSLLYFDGRYSHAAVKRAKEGEFRVQPEFGGSEEKIEPGADARALAEAAIAAAPSVPAYARVDMVATSKGPLIMELELIEPDMFLRYAPDGGAAFREAVLGRLN